MIRHIQPLLPLVALLVTGCAANVDQTCDEVQLYQTAKLGKRVEAPEGLDDLDSVREMEVPSASPREPRPEGSPCVDRPPQIQLGT